MMPYSPGISPKQVAEPVAYKLVRVDGDGRLVPTTDDEVMVVEDLFDYNEGNFLTETMHTEGYCTEAQSLLEKNLFPGSEDLLSECQALEDVAGKGFVPELTANSEKENSGFEETLPQSNQIMEFGYYNQFKSDDGCSDLPDKVLPSGSSSSSALNSLKPDFSLLNGEICLDDLTVKELHETFKATFGRETSVKDKQWLKRRISMGLTNSCDCSATTFFIKDNRVVKVGKYETCNDAEGLVFKDLKVGVENENSEGSSSFHVSETKYHENVPGKEVQKSSIVYNSITDELNTEQRTAKRIRKPTKRYIEELSEVESVESSGISTYSSKSSRSEKLRLAGHVHTVKSDGRPLVTRNDSFGGSQVQVPYVSRIRRSQPRKNLMALVKLQPNSINVARRLVKETLSMDGPPEDDREDGIVSKTDLLTERIQKPDVVRETIQLENYAELENMHLDRADVVAVPTPRGGLRRKHHRPWALSEVKLVEGVDRYGAGRWSDIKRFAFASSPYRTSVDLKDKWRNLLRASFLQLPAEKGMQNSRKQAVIPIPTPILLRVRELAEVHSQDPSSQGAIRLARNSESKVVHEARSGYL